MKSLIFIILLFSLFQFSISNRKRYQYEFETEEINANSNIKIKDDPNDRIDIDSWNELNKIDIKYVPRSIDYSNELEAEEWLEWYLRIAKRYDQIDVVLQFDYSTNITVENKQAIDNQSLIQSKFARKSLQTARKFNQYMNNSKNEDLKRIFSRLASGAVSYNNKDTKKVVDSLAQMKNIYVTTKVCERHNKKTCYTISSYLEQTMQIEKDYDRLLWAWKGWYNDCGNKIRPLYVPFIDLLNENAKENGYQDLSELWIEEYEMGTRNEFQDTIDQLLEDIMPLYKQLHAYVRGRLCSIYPNRFDCIGPIPAHLLGNMWAQNWQYRLDDLYPYPDTPLVNIKDKLEEKKYSIYKMYRTAEDFFKSIGLYVMTPKFWARSMFEKPTDRDVDCQAHASDFKYHDDYRVKICTQMDEENFYTVHHEMSHIEYFMSYEKEQPYVYQNGANPGFHEAIGDTIGLYAMSPKHSARLGFLEEEDINKRYQINYLMRLALEKIASIPFSYSVGKYQFLLFRGEINSNHELNSMWWALSIEHAGIMAAVPRTDANNFDPGANYHIIKNVPCYKYFIASILQFQFYRALCRLQGQKKQLHMCDIYGNKYVGMKLKEMLAMGNSQSWEDILYSLTGENRLESKALLDFFEPLHDWLKMENLRKGYPIGWM